MNTSAPTATTPPPPPFRLHLAREPEAPWAARAFHEDVPPATLLDARAWRDELRGLLARERATAADFLLALADFDRRRGWERLGHASLFAFLTRELGLSAGAAQLRLSAARLLPRHPAVEAALRDGRLCLSAAGQLARVLTAENEAEVLPRFFGRSSREAQKVAAAILPRPVPARPAVVTCVPAPAALGTAGALAFDLPVRSADRADTPGAANTPATLAQVATPAARQESPPATPPPAPSIPPGAAPPHAREVDARTPAGPSTAQVVPLTADLRRLHLTVTAGFLDRMARARSGLSHALPRATVEQVLEAALEALLEKQARRRSMGRRAVRRTLAGGAPLPAPSPRPQGVDAAPGASHPGDERPQAPAGRPPILASLERAVRLRDGDRCVHPLDGGGLCGSTWQLELDHVLPVALGGETTFANLRCLCGAHNRAAAREALGRLAEARTPRR